MEATTYQIQVQGKLDESWSQWFQGLTVTVEGNSSEGTATTTLTGPIADQAALRGLLTRILDLNLVLVSVTRETQTDADERRSCICENPRVSASRSEEVSDA